MQTISHSPIVACMAAGRIRINTHASSDLNLAPGNCLSPTLRGLVRRRAGAVAEQENDPGVNYWRNNKFGTIGGSAA
jgi:hypothetical protein